MAPESAIAEVASTPAAAPEAAPSTPSTPSAPSTPEVTPHTPQEIIAEAPQNDTSRDILMKTLEAKQAAEPKAEAAPPPAEVPQDAPKPEGGDEKPAVAAPEAKTEETPAVEPNVDEEPFSLEPRAPVAPSQMAQAFKKDPNLAKTLEAAGLDKDSLFANARLAQRAVKYDELYPGGVEEAEYAAESSKNFDNFSDLLTKAVDPDSTRAFLQAMLPFSYRLDEEGQPMIDPTTRQPMNDGTVGRLMDNILNLAVSYHENRVNQLLQANPNDPRAQELLAAIDVFKAETGMKRGTSSAEQEDMTPEQKRKDAEIRSREERLARDEQQRTQREAQEFETKVATQIDTGVNGMVKELLANVDLQGLNPEYVAKDIREGIFDKLSQNPKFYSRLDNLMRRPMGEKTLQERVGLGVKSAKRLLADVARDVLKKANLRQKANLEQKQATAASREQASRSEIKSAPVRVAPKGPMNANELSSLAEQEFMKANQGRTPTTPELIQAIAQKKRQLGG